jgi:hypothetical protein
VTDLERIEAKVDRLVALLEEFEPVLRAYVDPSASGPAAWAVRRKMAKMNGNGGPNGHQAQD